MDTETDDRGTGVVCCYCRAPEGVACGPDCPGRIPPPPCEHCGQTREHTDECPANIHGEIPF